MPARHQGQLLATRVVAVAASAAARPVSVSTGAEVSTSWGRSAAGTRSMTRSSSSSGSRSMPVDDHGAGPAGAVDDDPPTRGPHLGGAAPPTPAASSTAPEACRTVTGPRSASSRAARVLRPEPGRAVHQRRGVGPEAGARHEHRARRRRDDGLLLGLDLQQGAAAGRRRPVSRRRRPRGPTSRVSRSSASRRTGSSASTRRRATSPGPRRSVAAGWTARCPHRPRRRRGGAATARGRGGLEGVQQPLLRDPAAVEQALLDVAARRARPGRAAAGWPRSRSRRCRGRPRCRRVSGCRIGWP